MIIVEKTFFETNKLIGFALLASIFVHVAVISFFFIDKAITKEIDADVLRPQAIPVQIVFHAGKSVQPAEIYRPPAEKKQKPVVNVSSAPDKAVVKEPVEKTVTQQEQIATQNLNDIEPAAASAQQGQNIPVVQGASLIGRRVQPEYPRKALRLKQEGIVFLHVLISPTGTRQDIKLHKPSKYVLLNQAALKAVKKWTFDPNVVNGRAVQSWVEIPVEFKIQ